MLAYALIACGCVMLVSLSGKVVTWRGAGAYIEHNLHFFVSFAAGVLCVVALGLVAELRHAEGGILAGVPWIALGAVGIVAAFRYLPNFHHHHESDGHQHSLIDANRILLSDAVHNVADGAIIFLSFAISPFVGVMTTLGVILHETMQEISEFFVLREAGLSVKKALILNFLTSGTILLGALAAYLALNRYEAISLPLVGIAAGSYIIVVFHDLIPHSIANAREEGHTARHVGHFVAGLALMGLVSILVGH